MNPAWERSRSVWREIANIAVMMQQESRRTAPASERGKYEKL
jgi:hypothetical protein